MKKSFTLVELVVVIAIIAILASIITPNAFKAIEKARVAKTVADLEALKSAIVMLYSDTKKFPGGCPAFAADERQTNLAKNKGGLLMRPTVDAVPVGNCQWTTIDVLTWAGPYLEGGSVQDVWKRDYGFTDYSFCDLPRVLQPDGSTILAGDCDGDQSPKIVCDGACCGGAPCATPPPDNSCQPMVLISAGPDGVIYSCDDIIEQVSLDE